MTKRLVGLAQSVSLQSEASSDLITINGTHWQYRSLQAKISISRVRRSQIPLADLTAMQHPRNPQESVHQLKSVPMLLRSSLSGVSHLLSEFAMTIPVLITAYSFPCLGRYLSSACFPAFGAALARVDLG